MFFGLISIALPKSAIALSYSLLST